MQIQKNPSTRKAKETCPVPGTLGACKSSFPRGERNHSRGGRGNGEMTFEAILMDEFTVQSELSVTCIRYDLPKTSWSKHICDIAC